MTSGGEVSDRRAGLSGASYVEGRPVTDGIGVLLVQPAEVARDLSMPALGRLAMALALGLLVAVVIGYWVARRLTRPLVQAAAAANAMSSGQRDVRIDPQGPSEVADIAIALNRLSAALNESEGRQREFFLTVSHELRTPLTSVKGYAEALADGVVPPEDIPAVAGVVRSEADHLDRLVADLLDLARLGAADVAVEPVDLDLAGLGADAAAVWAGRAARAGVLFVDEVVRTPHPVRTDPVRVRQIIDNLMENALRVTGEGAPVVLRVSAGPAPAGVPPRGARRRPGPHRRRPLRGVRARRAACPVPGHPQGRLRRGPGPGGPPGRAAGWPGAGRLGSRGWGGVPGGPARHARARTGPARSAGRRPQPGNRKAQDPPARSDPHQDQHRPVGDHRGG